MTRDVGTAGGEFGRLVSVVIKPPQAAFRSEAAIAREWREFNFTAQPAYAAALHEYEAFQELLKAAGAEILSLPPAGGAGLDSLYVRDASVITPRGLVLCRMGKPQRAREPDAQGRALSTWGLPIAGAIEPPGTLEGGDVLWLDASTVCVGRGYRTNDAGIAQLRAFLGEAVECLVVPLPHWHGPGDVFHLMSIISPIDRDLAVVYSPLMPVPFREALQARGIAFVEVPDEEFGSMAANVLALAPRECVMIDGNPRTRVLLERAGATVHVYTGREISLKGGGGPTCLTRPIRRLVS